jgi:hypothetical protein
MTQTGSGLGQLFKSGVAVEKLSLGDFNDEIRS